MEMGPILFLKNSVFFVENKIFNNRVKFLIIILLGKRRLDPD